MGNGVSTFHSSSSGPGGVITSRFNDASGTGGFVSSSSSSNGGFGNTFVNPVRKVNSFFNLTEI